jgi:hypothetical protein
MRWTETKWKRFVSLQSRERDFRGALDRYPDFIFNFCNQRPHRLALLRGGPTNGEASTGFLLFANPNVPLSATSNNFFMSQSKSVMLNQFTKVLSLCLVVTSSVWLRAVATAADYAVVVSKAIHADPEWRKVVDELVDKHDGEIIAYDTSVNEALGTLQKSFPRYACFVATSAEASRNFVVDVHRMTRKLDDDPYADLLWGVLTGYDAANALTIAKEHKPLEIRRVVSGTELAMDHVTEGVWYCELEEHRKVRKLAGGEAKQERGPSDTTKAIADELTDFKPQLFVTSGHATERDWQIGFAYRNGTFRSEQGKLFGVDTKGQKFSIQSDNPKVYLPIGNCLMGHIDGPDAMTLAFMNSAGVRQMIGYTVPTWYGYSGWGCLDYFVEQPGRYTFTEAFFANQHALIERLQTNFPDVAKTNTPPGSFPRIKTAGSEAATQAGLAMQDAMGLLHDRDVVAFYGDPAWTVKMAPGKLAFEQTFKSDGDGVYSIEIKPLLGEASFHPVNKNGSQRGGRPFIQFLPERIRDAEILVGKELSPLITDNFVLIPNPVNCDPNKTYRVEFKANRMNETR